MSYSTFNGVNVIPMPSTPAPRQVTFTMTDTVGMNQSPFTGQQQVMAWPGADYWTAEVSLPPMTRSQAAAWQAFFAALRGKANVFQLGDPLGKASRGIARDFTAFLDGLHLASATTINMKGWPAGAGNLLLPGDYIQIGLSMHIVASPTPIAADAAGKCQIEIWPSLREAFGGDNAITFANVKGMFRLADNTRSWSATELKTYGISFKAVEAR
jgi:hypothetical protein